MFKTAVVSFFDVYPPKSGAGNVSWDFFQSIKGKKKFFQFSNKSINKKNIVNVNIIYNNPLFKMIFIPIQIYKIYDYLKNENKKLIIIEGASWVLYSSIIVFFFSFFKNFYIVYRSHNIEYELRGFKNSIFIKIITKYLENYLFNNCNLSTVVSDKDKKKIKKLYKSNPIIYPNSLNTKKILNFKNSSLIKLPKKYIFYCGSYKYMPNKIAIDFLIKNILPSLKNKGIRLVLTGGYDKKINDDHLINMDIVDKDKLKTIYKKSIALVAPIKVGFGTKLKIIEGICFGSNIITTKKGIEGIKFDTIENVKITSNNNQMIKYIEYFKNTKKKHVPSKKILNFYSVDKNTAKLFEIIRSNM